ncbi:MAG: TIGR00296 family protein [Thaumarchaeota archaeon]|jgi:uncharacterized protein (TIGR00296 family)|uniref:Protein HX834_05360 n=1 Tax=Marine Group I thaumarchaeote TaxID=2511932 RepID=A0A7K4MNZ0_9ARCH|nr:TIGR00296 family protein [Marine Group I thaumarchaeote]NWJ68754.1 TIGR00296 family protein [Marine Group I thaumarchaeote]RTZ69903.1 MAG: TIGR00296 family protein [Nitrososphaerota archaeon]RZD34321.1 MAG: TIGR00296 family protein [Nitrososphaerota archaeon]
MSKDIQLSDSDGVLLVKAARRAVTELLSNGNRIKLESDLEEKFSFNSGVFVTLNNPDGLRGCIGFPMPEKKLSHAIVDGAIAAATEDPRFSPVKIKELDDIVFEVTVLTPPVEIDVSDPLEYLSKIKVGRDGLIVRHSFSSGLLLPQVPVEYGWNVEEFLQHTCEKAGLLKDFWKNEDVKIEKFEGIIFKEETPNGAIVREET